MPRVPTLFAISAALCLVLGLFISRVGPFRESSMSYTWNGKGYMIPNEVLCFGIGCCLAFFSFLYSVWFVPYNVRALWWHFGLSIACIVTFYFSFVLTCRSNSRPALAALALMVLTPYLFLLLQVGFALDAFRRVMQWARH